MKNVTVRALKIATIASFLIAIFWVPNNADATSVQLYGGIGTDAVAPPDSYLSRGGVRLFFYEGRYLDIFTGAEYAEGKHETDTYFRNGGYLTFKYNYIAGVLGLRIKPIKRERVNPYLTIAVIGGEVNYHSSLDVSSNTQNEIISMSKTRALFVTWRAGVGMDIKLPANFSLGLELDWTGGLPKTSATVLDHSTGMTHDVRLESRSRMVGLEMGLRYRF